MRLCFLEYGLFCSIVLLFNQINAVRLIVLHGAKLLILFCIELARATRPYLFTHVEVMIRWVGSISDFQILHETILIKIPFFTASLIRWQE